ncbi:MAG: DUF4105 domain-containing protein [Bacteroidota bacterium]
MTRPFLFALALGLWSLTPAASSGQIRLDSLSQQARISLLTITPGTEAYSMYGHSAVRVTDPSVGLDVTYNYGTFSFGNVLTFIPRFLYGSLDYFLSISTYTRLATSYMAERRATVEQVLDLSAAQRQALFVFLQENARPENRTYRYDFLYDNCSTRIRDALAVILGEDLVWTAASDTVGTFRALLDPYEQQAPLLDVGMDLILGPSIDGPATAHEAMFLPDYLFNGVEGARIRRGGELVPLVAHTDTLTTVPPRSATLPAVWVPALLWGLFLGAAGATGWQLRHRRTLGVRLDGVLFGTVGLGGIIMLYMWFGSLHHVTDHNWHVLWAWPTHVVVALALVRPHPPRWVWGYCLVALLGTSLALLSVPLWPQSFHPALLPVLLLLILRLGARVWSTRPGR